MSNHKSLLAKFMDYMWDPISPDVLYPIADEPEVKETPKVVEPEQKPWIKKLLDDAEKLCADLRSKNVDNLTEYNDFYFRERKAFEFFVLVRGDMLQLETRTLGPTTVSTSGFIDMRNAYVDMEAGHEPDLNGEIDLGIDIVADKSCTGYTYGSSDNYYRRYDKFPSLETGKSYRVYEYVKTPRKEYLKYGYKSIQVQLVTAKNDGQHFVDRSYGSNRHYFPDELVKGNYVRDHKPDVVKIHNPISTVYITVPAGLGKQVMDEIVKHINIGRKQFKKVKIKK